MVNFMNRKKVSLGAFVLLALFFGMLVTNSVGFTQDPQYIDPGGDHEPAPICTDILKVWIANDATYLRFKLELNGSLNQYDGAIYFVFISIDNNTGSNWGWDLPIYYRIQFEIEPDGELFSYFEDFVNGTNIHTHPFEVGLLYYTLSNNNHTLEFGYKIQTTDEGKGHLNVSIGQTIYLKFQGDLDSDYAPDLDALLRYVLTEESGGIPGFGLPFLSLAVLSGITFYFLAKKKALI
jgi:hypothetical protein